MPSICNLTCLVLYIYFLIICFFCFPCDFNHSLNSAKVVVQLAQSDEYIQAGALLHPSFVTVDDIKGKFN